MDASKGALQSFSLANQITADWQQQQAGKCIEAIIAANRGRLPASLLPIQEMIEGYGCVFRLYCGSDDDEGEGMVFCRGQVLVLLNVCGGTTDETLGRGFHALAHVLLSQEYGDIALLKAESSDVEAIAFIVQKECMRRLSGAHL